MRRRLWRKLRQGLGFARENKSAFYGRCGGCAADGTRGQCAHRRRVEGHDSSAGQGSAAIIHRQSRRAFQAQRLPAASSGAGAATYIQPSWGTPGGAREGERDIRLRAGSGVNVDR
ncbi:hypothetical protein NDU88_004377 [Pleurodeles waltl]|uniref:Uncharacterized protein n=1 Tax=Pleurodeles waltl TaxID=8319 RepID=A0AAV7KY87_PLEWA|nr:hypothetical protein NDU88_004377 [Pleurodeles waltl]